MTTARRTELRRTAEAQGITLFALHWLLAKTTGYYLTSPDPAIQKKTGDYFSALAEACAELGGTILVLGSPKQRDLLPGVTKTQADEYALRTIEHCLPTLAKSGVMLCLEPLGPAETNYLNTAEEAVSLIRKLGHPNVRLHLDVKAMSSESKPIPEIIRANAESTTHFHANDPNLRGPGFGDVDFKPIFQALADKHYSGWVSVEVFDYSPDPDTIARESIRYMTSCSPLPLRERGQG